jgi:hypothetical protein
LRFRQDARAFGESRRILPVLRSRISVDESRRMVYGGSWPVATIVEVSSRNRRLERNRCTVRYARANIQKIFEPAFCIHWLRRLPNFSKIRISPFINEVFEPQSNL